MRIQNHKNLVYLLILGGTAVMILTSVLGFNAVVDPYRMFDRIDFKRLNHEKPAIYNRVRLLKAYELRRVKPDSILLGTSRCHLAFNPENPKWKNKSKLPYNAAFDGATTKEMFSYLRHAQNLQPLKYVLLGLDTYHATDAPGSQRPDFDPTLLADQSGWWRELKFLMADLKILLSFDTFLNSINTLLSQTGQTAWLSTNGQRLGEVFFHEYEQEFINNGPRAYFEQIDQNEVGYKLEWKIPQKTLKVYPPKEELKDRKTSFEYIRSIVDFCRVNKIELIVFFTPSHAHQLELSAATGDWEQIESAKRRMVGLMEEFKQQGYLFPLYDFSVYSPVTTEPLPSGGQKEMQYYWDSSHFKENVGDAVLDCVLSNYEQCSLGIKLTAANIEEHLREERLAQEAYGQTNVLDVQNIRAMVSEYKEKHGIK